MASMPWFQLAAAAEEGLSLDDMSVLVPLICGSANGSHKNSQSLLNDAVVAVIGCDVEGAPSKLDFLGVLIADIDPISLIEVHLSRLLPVLLAMIDSLKVKSETLRGSLEVLSTLFGRWDGLTCEGRGSLAACCGRLIPLACSAIRSGFEAESMMAHVRFQPSCKNLFIS
jgi:hypothetical protein